MRKIFTLLFVLSCVVATAQVAPTVPASNLRFSSIEGAGFQINFDAGNGATKIVVLKEGSPVTGLPENGKEYTANSNFATAGTEFSVPGEYVVLKNSNWATVTVAKLKPGTTYYVAVFEYNGTGTAARYLMVPLTGSQATVSAPTVQTSGVGFSEITGNTAKMSWTNGNGSGRLILARKAAPINAEPTDLSFYYPNYAGEYGSGIVINGDNYTVYRGSGTSVTLYRLEPNTTYHLAFFEFNGNNTPVYLKPASNWSVTTNAGPTKPTQYMTFGNIEGSRITVGGGPGNGSKRLLIARKGAPVTALPVNGQVYNASATFGSGSEIAAGQYVVSNTSSQSTLITNLEPNTTYYFRYIEFDEGENNNTYYLTSSPLDGSKSTATPPAGVSTNLAVTNLTGSSATVTYTPGPGTYKLAVLKEGSPVDAVPQDLIYYNGNVAFGSGTEIGAGSGNYSMAGGMNSNSFNISGLKTGKTYYAAIFDFNGTYYPVYNKTPATISFTVPLQPTQAATNFLQLSKEGDRMWIRWDIGNGSKRIVVAKKGSPVTAQPQDGISYNANAAFGQGSKLAEGEYVIYDGNSNNVTTTNLEIGATYYFAVYEYNESEAGLPDYLVSSYLSGNAATFGRPTQSTSGLNATAIQSAQANISFTGGNGNGRMFIMKANTPVDGTPQDFVSYNYSTAYGSFQLGSTGNYIVYKTTAATGTFTVTGLSANTTYYVTAFEYNGSTQPAFMMSGNSFSFKTTDVPGATVPTTPASNALFSANDGNKFTFKWTNGDGAGRIVVMRQGSPVSFTPESATSYTANAAFGAGTDLGNNQYVVYNGNGSSVTVTNLLPATTYYLTVFEYNGSGSLLRYLTGSTLITNGATVSAPLTAGSNAVASATNNSMTLNWTNGSGSGRLVVVKKGSAVTSNPADLSVYPANTVFKSGAQIGIDEYVVYSGNSNTVTVTALATGGNYYYKIFEYNGSAAPVYNINETLSGNVPTGALPVTWINFDASEKNGKVVLNWATSAETNSAYFIVERSMNGIDFHETGRVQATGNGIGKQQYTFTDEIAAQSKLFYRLKQTDNDGLFSYSKIVTIQSGNNIAAVRLQPNPVQNTMRIQLPANVQSAGMLIYNAAGVLMLKQTIGNQQTVNVQHLPAGTYYIVVQQNEKKYQLKMIKQ
jgi:hypothetical protein